MVLPRLSTQRPLRWPGLLALSVVLGVSGMATPAAAQREIVQALPRQEADDLNAALRRLSANPEDLDALLQAGAASLALNDVSAAEGFYTRALALAPSNGYVKLGLARIRLQGQDAVAALKLFDEAERAGVPASAMAAERGFAFDLVGDQTRAQAAYRTALAAREDDEIRRRLALSLAISGRRQAFEDAILPLLNANDRAAFRTRAFGLAILGDEQEAVVIAETMLPTDLALRLTPYLRYMPRLTAAQQAAAANLGVFPPAAEIGRDDAAVAGYAARGQRIARTADAALAPTGEPFGSNRNQSTPPVTAPPAERTRSDRVSELPPVGQTTPAPQPSSAAVADNVAEPATTSRPSVPQIETRVAQSGSPQVAETSANPAVIVASTPPPSTIALPEPTEEPSQEVSQPVLASVADAFADFGNAAPGRPVRVADAVDITAITPPREVEREEPPAPVHPSRHWVQVATGRDLAALKFDWRRISRGAEGKLEGKGPFTAPWGQANRLLAGPYPTIAAAREKVTELKALEIDSFPFTSEEGEAIAPLD
ncbi:MAG: tetratricopeptide repeat protein [Erythrobacter sp.]|nr:tetratricopeptide repeat protein [Erythrobacter sp.]